MSKKSMRFSLWNVVSIVILAVFLLFIVYPLFKTMKNALIDPEGNFTLQYFIKFFGETYYSSTLVNSIKVAAAAMICSLLIGIPLAYVCTIYSIKGQSVLQILIVLCSMSAPFVGAYSWILLMGRAGVITSFMKSVFHIATPSIYGFGGITLVMTSKLFPLVYLYVCGALKNVDNSLLEASENMGCAGMQKFFKVTLPLCMPSIIAVAFMVFIRAMADFGTPLLIGEGYRTFAVEIYKQYVGESGTTHNFAAAISVVAIAITAVMFFGQKMLAKHYSFKMNALHPIQKKSAGGLFGIVIHIFAYVVTFISFMPQVYVIYTSFRKTSSSGTAFVKGYTLKNYQVFFDRMGTAVPTTLIIGVSTLALTVVLAVLVAYLVVRHSSVVNNIIDTLSMMPYVIPGSVVGISLVMAFNSGPIVLTGTVIIMIIAISIRRMPYTIRSSVATLQQIPITVEEAAESLGTGKLRTFIKISIPMMANGILSGAILSWITILTELSSSIILYSSKAVTLTLATYIFVSRGTYGGAAASATILTLFTTISLLLFFKLTGSKDIAL